jgi:dihydrofolate reductase
MRKLVVQVFDYSLDGIIGVEDTAFFDFCREFPDDPEQQAWRRSAFERAGLHIMGRKTYEGMAGYLPTAEADHPYAKIINTAPKAVFSSTLKSPGWNNATIINGDTATEIEKLKQDGTGDIMTHGGVSFVQSLVRLDLADEYMLTVFPYLAGPGASLFAELQGPQPLELVSSTAFGNGMVGLVYRRPSRP